jgi:hypothetical protein
MTAGMTYQDLFSPTTEDINRRATARADFHGMKSYGPAPVPLEEKRDLYQESIEELLDAIYYLTRQVAMLKYLRERLPGEADGMEHTSVALT